MNKRTFAAALLLSLAAAPAGSQTPAGQAAMSEAEIAGAVKTANDVEVDAAQAALIKSSNGAVKSFAMHMRGDHTAANQELAALAQNAGLTPAESAVSQLLKTMAQQDKARLDLLSGDAYDRAYIDGQVQAHQKALEIINGSMNSVRLTDLTRLLMKAQEMVTRHLQEAQQLQKSLPGMR